MTNQSNAIGLFKDLANQKTLNSETVKTDIIAIFKAYPEASFKQSDFASRLNKRTQHINQVLKSLLTEKLILREGSKKQYYYRLNK